MSSDFLNILIVCEHASDTFGGEAVLPLNYFKFLSKTDHNVYLITHARVKANLSENVKLNQDNIFYIPDTSLHKLLHKISLLLPARLSVVSVGFLMNLVTQYYQRKLAKKIISEKEIDLVHEPAPVSATQPSAMFNLGVPVVIGPMNGGMNFPEAFEYMAGKVERFAYKLVRMFASFMNRMIPGKRNASLLLVANKRTAEAIPSSVHTPIQELVENAAFSVKNKLSENNKTDGLSILYVGRLVDWKCVDIAIDAVAKNDTGAKLKIVGDGDKRAELEAYVESNDINNVEFCGKVSHSQVNQFYDEADIFILPSVRECGGAVVLEAMSRGVPVLATGWGGPMDYITPETGFLVPPKSREFMVKEFSRLIDELSSQPEKRHQFGLNAMQRVKEHFLWDKKIEKIIGIYKGLVKT